MRTQRAWISWHAHSRTHVTPKMAVFLSRYQIFQILTYVLSIVIDEPQWAHNFTVVKIITLNRLQFKFLDNEETARSSVTPPFLLHLVCNYWKILPSSRSLDFAHRFLFLTKSKIHQSIQNSTIIKTQPSFSRSQFLYPLSSVFIISIYIFEPDRPRSSVSHSSTSTFVTDSCINPGFRKIHHLSSLNSSSTDRN